jgi:hypothetical protein
MTTPTATPPTAEQLTELRREIASLTSILRDIQSVNKDTGYGWPEMRGKWIAEARVRADAIYQTVRTMECEATGPAGDVNTDLVKALRHIGYEPIGHAEATDREVCEGMTEIARAALAKAGLS